jgi:hypothetical protein
MGKVEYIRCPRCELNYIEKSQNLCKVCEAELASKGNREISDEEAKELNLCPICKTNYLMDDEDICSECAIEQAVHDNQEEINISSDNEVDEKEDRNESWRQYVENDDEELPEDEFGDMSSITTEDESDDILADEDMGFDEKDEEEIDDFDDFDEDFDETDDELDDDFDDEDDFEDEEDDEYEDDEE